MLKQKKKISLITLAFFMLTLVFAGAAPVLAAKSAPSSPPAATIPSSPSSDGPDSPSGVSPEGEAVKDSISGGPVTNASVVPWLETMKVSDNRGELLSVSDPVSAEYSINVPKTCEGVKIDLDPKDLLSWFIVPLEWVTKVKISADSAWGTETYDNPEEDDNFIVSDDITLNPGGQATEITITLYSNKGLTKEYILNIYPVDVSLELNGEAVAEGQEIFMSEGSRTLIADIVPGGANPVIYDWDITGSTASVSITGDNPSSDRIVINPDSDTPGTVFVTLRVMDEEGTLDTAGCIIHVGKIEVWVEGDPTFNVNGSYEAGFGYENTFPVDVTILVTGDIGYSVNECWSDVNHFDGSGEIDGVIPSKFLQGKYNNVFSVKYWDDSQKWIVICGGYCSIAKAKTFQSIELNSCFEVLGLGDNNNSFDLVATPSFSKYGTRDEGSQEEIVWDVVWETDKGVVTIDGAANQFECTVKAMMPGMAIVRVSIADNCLNGPGVQCYNRKQALCIFSVLDNRTLELDKETLSISRSQTGVLNAVIDYEDLDISGKTVDCFLPDNWNEVQWGFVVGEGCKRYIVPTSEYVSLNATGTNMEASTVKGLENGTVTVVAYLGNNFYSKSAMVRAGVPQEYISELESQCFYRKFYLWKLPADRYDTCEVTVRSTYRVVRFEDKPEIKETPAPPAPPALDTLDVFITVGDQVALVNGEEVTLAGYPLLLGENQDRAMVDYADMTKLIPGLEVVWDWKTLSVTFTKDDKELKMVLDEIPADFDIPFINIGGRLVVPVRYVGNFFGAAVDWIGSTLVVHMYK